MDDKRNALLTVGLLCAVLFVLGIADLCNSDRVYSETENRVLASRPTFSWESLLSGEYGDDYEEYMSDQFVGRNKDPRGYSVSEKGDQWSLSGGRPLSDRGK